MMSQDANDYKRPPAFNPMLVLVVILVGVFSFSAFMSLSAFAPDLQSRSNAGNHAWSKSAIGYAAFALLLEADGTFVIKSREPETERQPDDLLILTPGSRMSAYKLLELADEPTLIVLPKWATSRYARNPEWVYGHGLQDSYAITRLASALVQTEQKEADKAGPKEGNEENAKPEIEADANTSLIRKKLQIKRVRTDTSVAKQSAAPDPIRYFTKKGKLPDNRHRDWIKEHEKKQITEQPIASNQYKDAQEPIHLWQTAGAFADRHFQTGVIENLQTIQYSGLEPLIHADKSILLGKIPGRELYILSDPDLMNTLGIRDIQNPMAALTIIKTITNGEMNVMFDMGMHGFSRQLNLLKTLLMPPFLAATLCALAVAALMAWAAWFRFGTAQRQEMVHALGKQVLADNSAALIRMAGRQGAMLHGYGELSRDLAAKAAGVPKGYSKQQMDQLLERMAKNAGVKTSFAELQQQNASMHHSHAQIVALANKYYQWRGEISREN